jgi:hypothetical protein
MFYEIPTSQKNLQNALYMSILYQIVDDDSYSELSLIFLKEFDIFVHTSFMICGSHTLRFNLFEVDRLGQCGPGLKLDSVIYL